MLPRDVFHKYKTEDREVPGFEPKPDVEPRHEVVCSVHKKKQTKKRERKKKKNLCVVPL